MATISEFELFMVVVLKEIQYHSDIRQLVCVTKRST